jgi:hypothetical protein
MTKAYSKLYDNNGLCEGCNLPETARMPQRKCPVMLGGGLGMGTMWLCDTCRAAKLARDKARKGPTKPTQLELPIRRGDAVTTRERKLYDLAIRLCIKAGHPDLTSDKKCGCELADLILAPK